MGLFGSRWYILFIIIMIGIAGVLTYLPDDLQIPVDDSLPRIRPLRRQIRYFEPGKTGEITIVYQTSHPDLLTVRWFRRSENLPNAEISDHLPTQGDPRYSLHYLAVNDVKAVTLKVADVEFRDFPMSFVLIVTAGYPAIEYQLKTNINNPVGYSIKVLDEIRWVALTGTPIIFGYHGFLSITCVAVLDSESKKSTDELGMYRMSFEKESFRRRKSGNEAKSHLDDSEVGNITSVGTGKIHIDKFNYVEESGAYMTIGSRTELPLWYYRYEVTRRIMNATWQDEGAYACGLERVEDKSYASSWVREGKPHRKPALEVLPCETLNTKTKRRRDQDFHYKITLHQHRETCIRCRAFGFPQADLVIMQDGSEVTSNDDHNIDQHVNVADGGLREVTLTFWYPQLTDAGMYECQAYHGNHVETLKFKVEVRLNN